MYTFCECIRSTVSGVKTTLSKGTMSTVSFCSGAFSRKRSTRQSQNPRGTAKSFLTAKGAIKKPNDLEARPYREKGWWARDRPTFTFAEYNIFHIHAKILEHLGEKITSVPELISELKSLSILMNAGNEIEKISATQQSKMLRKRIVDLEGTFELMVYRMKTEGIVEEYRSTLGTGSRSFMSVAKIENVDIERERKLSKLTTDFMRVAMNYINVEDLVIKPSTIRCPSCDSIKLDLSLKDDHIYICTECGTEVETLDNTPTFKDTDRVNMSSKYSYSRKGHFLDAKKRYQGIQNTDPTHIQAAVNTVLDTMKKHRLVAEQNVSSSTGMKSVTKDHVHMFLSEQDLSQHYDDINLIFHIITGVPCPQFSPELDMALNEDFDAIDEILQENKSEDDINSLNVNFKLLCLLKRRGFPCRRDEFYILKTKAKEDEHIEKMQQAFAILGWEWPL